MSINETYYIKKCLDLIVERQGWGPPQEWTQTNFIRLSEEIIEVSKVNISYRTLRRLFGKDNYNDQYKPQYGTKNALAYFLGYEGWDDFIKKQNEAGNKKQPAKKFILNHKKIVTLTVIIISITIIAFTLLMKRYNKEQIHNGMYSFSASKTSGYIPFSAKINIDVRDIPSNNIYLRLSPGSGMKKISKSDTLVYHTFQTPMYNPVKLMVDSIVIDSIFFHAKTKGWEAAITNNYNYYPVQLGKRCPGFLCVSENALENLGDKISRPEYWLKYFYYEDINIDADNLIFEFRARGDTALNEIKCVDQFIWLQGDKSRLKVNIAEKGCSQYASVNINDLHLEGFKHDLDGLTVDIRHWHTYKYITKDGQLTIKYDDAEVFTTDYPGEMGLFKGLVIRHRGCGVIDYVKLTDSTGKEVYYDDFD